MSYLGSNIESGSWKRAFHKKHPNPLDISEQFCLAAALWFKGQAQALAFMKSLTGGTVPASVKSRLAVAVMNSMTGSFETMSGVFGAPTLLFDAMTHIWVLKRLYTALAYQYAAQAYLEKTEVGNCIGFCLVAKVSCLFAGSLNSCVYSCVHVFMYICSCVRVHL
jgi:hypothetical protein